MSVAARQRKYPILISRKPNDPYRTTDTPKSVTFHASNSMYTCNNYPPIVSEKKVTKLGAGQSVNQTGVGPTFEIAIESDSGIQFFILEDNCVKSGPR